MKTDKYFYSVIKNEDAIPYVSGNLIIVADGLGGAGSTVHNIERVGNMPMRDRIYKAAFSDFDLQANDEICGYLEQLVAPMADEKPDTSAMWASRIAIARCAYALDCNADFKDADLKDQKVRKALADYISAGLDKTARYFKLEKGKYDDQKTLPTTLAMIRYKSDDKSGKTVADVVWAGDSRCYVLTKDGLRQLSIDDEDASGLITNLFCADNKNPTTLGCRRYNIGGPCVLMAVSDGIFDPFEPRDNFAVEKILLDNIAQSNSYEELMDNLKEFYDAVRGDDATMAIAPIGFGSYKSLQKALQKRTKSIMQMWQKFSDMQAALDVVNQPEEDIRSYVENRTRDKFSAIIPVLLDGCKEKKDDPIYTQEVIDKITGIKTQLAQMQKIEESKRAETAINELRRCLQMCLSESPENVFTSPVGFSVSGEVVKLIDKVKRSYDDIENAKKKKNKIDVVSSEITRYRESVKERIEYYWRKYNECGYDAAKIIEKDKASRLLKVWMQIDMQFARGFKITDEVRSLESSDKQLARDLNNFIVINKSVLSTTADEMQKSIEYFRSEYCKAIDKLFEQIPQTPQICEKVFKVWVVEKYKLTAKQFDGKKAVDATDISAAIQTQKDEISTAIVNALAKNCDRTSMLDGYYNATRLNSFRYYYKVQAQPRDGIAEFEKQLNALESEYEEFIAEKRDN